MMKKINFETLNERNNYSLLQFIERGVNMEFIKKGENYLIKNSNGRVVSEKEKLELENGELIIKDITSNECQKETTKKISKNKKRIKELEKENEKINFDLQPIDSKRVVKYIKEQTALQNKENADGTIEEIEKANDTLEETAETI